jgi:foldase protein PrsA
MLRSLPLRTSSTRARRPLALAALPALALAVVAGCGDSVPGDAVANVDGEIVTKKQFGHWLQAAARSQGAAQPGTPVAVPDPPRFDRCAGEKVRQPQGRGAPKLNPQQAREMCKQEYDVLRDQVMQFLISSRWVELEAAEQGVEATPAEVDRTFQEQKQQSFPSDREYQEFLRASGQTEQDIKHRVKLDVLSNEVRKKVVGDQGEVSNAEIRDYYNRNRAQFGQPERRELSVVVTENQAEARRAKQALEDDQSFRTVARRYSIDDASKRSGGKLTVTKGQQEQALDQAVFSARRGQLVGPVKTQLGWYVFRVEKITPGSQQSFDQSRETIKSQLRAEKEQKALDKFVREFQKEYKEVTNCARGYVIYQCKNGPKEPPQQGVPGAPPGAQGGAPPGAQGGAPPSGGQGAPPPQNTPGR